MTSTRNRVAVLVAMLVVLSGVCSPRLSAQNRRRDTITRDELLAAHSTVDLYQAIRGLRPQFLAAPLTPRTRTIPTTYFVDGILQQNGIDALRSIPTTTVERVEYLDPGRAESELGHRAAGGAVMVTLQGGRRLPSSVRDTTTPPPER